MDDEARGLEHSHILFVVPKSKYERLGQKKLTWMDRIDRMNSQAGFEISNSKAENRKPEVESRKLKPLPILSILSIHVNFS
jgi:hypothetical protein